MPLTHVDRRGAVRMVDVSPKAAVHRVATARGHIRLQPGTVRLLRRGLLAKGDALACARIAGIMAAKRTSEIIPLCHNIPLDRVSVEPRLGRDRVEIQATAVSTGRTGVEMEALTAVAAAALTVYDMCKAVDKKMLIAGIRLVSKSKGAGPTHAREK